MTSKERVIAAINHEETDKVPVDLGGSIQTTIHAYAYAELKKALSINTGHVEIMDTFILAAIVEDSVREALQIDTIPILCPEDGLGVRNDVFKREWIMPNGLKVMVSEDFDAVKQPDGSYLLTRDGFKFKLPDDGYYFDPVRYVLQEATSIHDIDQMFDFSGYGEREAVYFRKQAEKLKGTDKLVMGDVFASFSAEDHFGYEKAFMNLLIDRELTIYFIERLTEMFIRNFDLFFDAVGDIADIMMMHKDMGQQEGPIISLEIARDVFFPFFKKFVSHVKEKSNYYIMMHNCGSIYQFLPDLIECGIDIINPVQITAKDMEPEKIKSEFGTDICFWGGGVDTQYVLPFGTEEDVRRQVRENAEIFSKGSGYVFNPVHCIQANVPARNIITAFDEINRFKP